MIQYCQAVIKDGKQAKLGYQRIQSVNICKNDLWFGVHHSQVYKLDTDSEHFRDLHSTDALAYRTSSQQRSWTLSNWSNCSTIGNSNQWLINDHFNHSLAISYFINHFNMCKAINIIFNNLVPSPNMQFNQSHFHSHWDVRSSFKEKVGGQKHMELLTCS